MTNWAAARRPAGRLGGAAGRAAANTDSVEQRSTQTPEHSLHSQ